MRQLFLILCAILALATDGWAQARRHDTPAAATPCKLPSDKLLRPECQDGGAQASGDALQQLQDRIAKLSLADFQYALALAKATNNIVTQPCWAAWVALIEAQQSPLKDDKGNALAAPDPHVITDLEKLSELVNQLQPSSQISTGCAPMAQAAQKTIGNLIGAVLSGGALGLFKLPFALP